MNKPPKVVMDRVTREITEAYKQALKVVPRMRGMEPQDVYGNAELQSAVLTAALSTVATRQIVSDTLAEALAPRKCRRPGCVNEATRHDYGEPGPRQLAWCSSACRAWTRRMERQARDFPICAHCGVEAGYAGIGRPRKFCSDRCRVAAYRARKRTGIRTPRSVVAA